MEFASRTDVSWSTSSGAVLRRAGSLAVLVVVLEAVDTRRLCRRVLWAPDSMPPLDLVVSVAVGEEVVSAAAEGVEVAAIDSVDLVEESVTREPVTALVGRHPRTHLLDRVVDVVGLGEEEDRSVEIDSTAVLPVATASLSAPATATRTATAVTTETVTVMAATAIVTVTAVMTAAEIAAETASVATETVIGMAAERTMDASDTVRMTPAMMTRAPADDTKCSPHGYSLLLFSASFCWWVPLLSFARPLLRKGKGVRRETVHMESGSDTAERKLSEMSPKVSGSNRHVLLFVLRSVSSNAPGSRLCIRLPGSPESWSGFVSHVFSRVRKVLPFHFSCVFSCLCPNGTLSLRGVSMYS